MDAKKSFTIKISLNWCNRTEPLEVYNTSSIVCISDLWTRKQSWRFKSALMQLSRCWSNAFLSPIQTLSCCFLFISFALIVFANLNKFFAVFCLKSFSIINSQFAFFCYKIWMNRWEILLHHFVFRSVFIVAQPLFTSARVFFIKVHQSASSFCRNQEKKNQMLFFLQFILFAIQQHFTNGAKKKRKPSKSVPIVFSFCWIIVFLSS